MDLFVVPTLAFSLLYGFVIVRLDRRDLVWIAVTRSPTAEWVARQITEAFPWDSAPQYLVRDRDRVFGSPVRHRLRAMGARQTHCTSLAVAERFCRTIDWVHSPRVPGPHDRPRRGSPAPVADLLRKLLQRNQNASRASERRADPPPNRADWYPGITSDSRRTSSPIRPNVVFGTHKSDSMT